MLAAVLLALSVVLASCEALTPTSSISATDKLHLKRLFDSVQPFQDLATAHYATLGYKLLGEQIAKAAEVCKYAQSQIDANNVESIFHGSGLSKALGNCPLVAKTYSQTLNAAIVEGSTSTYLYYAVTAQKNLGLPVDSAKVSKALTAARKKDDSALSLGYAFHVASLLSGDVSSFVGWIEDTVVQADEIDGRMLQFEGGLSISAIIVSGIYRLAEHGKKAPPAMDAEKCVKFANYFLSRKQVQVVRAAYHLLDVLQILSNNKYHIPVSIALVSRPSVAITQPLVVVQVSNIMGSSLGQIGVTVESALKIGETTPVTVKKPMTLVKGQSLQYELNLDALKLGRGFYKLTINANPSKADPRWVGNTGAVVQVKLETEVLIENVEVGVGDIDQSTAPRLIKVNYPEKLPSVLEADYHQKLQMKFVLRDKHSKEVMTAHQTFIQLTHKKSGREIVFVAEPDSSNTYKFDLDVQSKSKVFGHLSGGYSMALIIGDAMFSNPCIWQLADVELGFHDSTVEQPKQATEFSPKPEIKHVFREPEKRPPPVFSTTFTGLTLVPVLLLFILWIKIGVNVSNFHLNLGTIGFHLGLGGIFGLFVVFFLQLTMFETLKYLILLGVVTFLCGNSMLSKLANAQK